MQAINWFPGHMAKARREMQEALAKVDAVLELVDARLPDASANPMLHEILESKPRVVVMTRTDLADPVQTKRWEVEFEQRGVRVVTVDARNGRGVNDIVPALEDAAKAKREREAKRGIRPRPLRVMVVGIPNVGKSSLINRLAGRVAAKTGDRPGITQQQQWIRLGNVDLLDTPGVLWPKLDDQRSALALAISGAIKSDVLDIQTVCAYFILWCKDTYPQYLQSRYQLKMLPDAVWTDAATAWEAVEPTMIEIARRRGFVRSGGIADFERTADQVIREAQTGQIGRMTFQWVSTDAQPDDNSVQDD